MAPAVQEFLARVAKAHAALPPSPHVGRVMGLRANPTTR
jgi:hypothetical protein